MDNKILQLIQVVNNNYTCISQLETLSEQLEFNSEEHIVAVTTINSHYDYKRFISPLYQNPDMHVDKLVVDDRVEAVGNRIIRAGTVIIAIDPCDMDDDEGPSLTIGKDYLVREPSKEDDPEQFSIVDDQKELHWFLHIEFDKYFKLK